MTVVGVRVELPNNAPVVLLQETGSNLTVPIWVGASEAIAISTAMEGVTPPRPMTHDLCVDMLRALDVSLVKATVTHVNDNVFYAELLLSGPTGSMVVSSRPSDAIALVVRTGAPLFATREVLDEVGIILAEESVADEDETVARFREMLEEITVEDFIEPDEPSE